MFLPLMLCKIIAEVSAANTDRIGCGSPSATDQGKGRTLHAPQCLEVWFVQADEVVACGGKAQAVQGDVTDNAAQERAFERHLERFQSMDIVCLNAGILEKGRLPFLLWLTKS